MTTTKKSTKSDMAAKSKTYFLLDYRFISYIYILFISVFSSLPLSLLFFSMQDGCSARVQVNRRPVLLFGSWRLFYHTAPLAREGLSVKPGPNPFTPAVIVSGSAGDSGCDSARKGQRRQQQSSAWLNSLFLKPGITRSKGFVQPG